MTPQAELAPGGSELERMVRFVLDQLPVMVYAVDRDSRITMANRAVKHQWGRSVESLVGLERADMLSPADAAVQSASDRQVLEEGRPFQGVEYLAGESGRRCFLTVRAPLRDPHGEPAGVAIVATDVTEMAAVHEQLQVSESRHRLLFEQNPQPMLVYDVESLRFLAINETAVETYGYSREEFLEMGIDRIRPMEDVPDFMRWLRDQPAGSRSKNARHVKKDGQLMDVAIRSNSVNWEGRTARLVAVTDVTERNQAASELDGFFSLSQNLASILTRDGKLLRCNARWRETLGFEPSELVGRSLCELVHPGDRVLAQTALESAAAGNEVEPFIVRIQARSGAYSVIECRARSARDRIYCIAQDVTERMQVEGRLRDLSLAVEQSPASVVITDCEGRIEYVNSKFQQVTGYTGAEVLGQTPRILKSGLTSPESYERMWKTIKSGRIWEGEFHNKRKDGSIYTERATISPILDTDGTIRHFVAVKEDITQQRILERQLHEAQKLEAIGLLAAGIAHDFNNLLTIINGHSELLEADPNASVSMLTHIAAVRKAGDQASNLTRQLLLFGSQQVGEPRVLDLSNVVDNLKQFYRRVLPENIKLVIDSGDGPARVVSDQSQMEQIVTNLVVNARDAMPNGGQLTIQCELVMLTGDPAEHAPESQRGPHVRLSVTDTGEGMTEQTRMRIFEPFFTTKPTGHGTGLGLSTVYGIVKQAKGWIHVESTPGVGTRFQIYIPASDAEVTPIASVVTGRLEPGSAEETILLVEDFDEVREFTASLLTVLGYQVITASSGEEALEIARARRGAIDVLVTDVMLPGLSGAAAAQQICTEYPGVKVLLVSGYVAAVPEMNSLLAAGATFLAKPFSAVQLRDRIEELLRRSNRETRILVVDDDPAIRELFRGVLEDAGYQVEIAEDGVKALRCLTEQAVDLVLMDLAMPGMEGLETLRTLRGRGNQVPLIAISGVFGDSMMRAARIMGAHATLPKPVTRSELLRTVNDVLRRTSQRQKQ